MINGLQYFELPASAVAGTAEAVAPSFAVSAENRLLAPALRRLLEGERLADAASMFNPLVLVGPPGSGKTMLVRGIVRRWQSLLTTDAVAYFSADDFARDATLAQSKRKLAEWRIRVYNLQLLVVEGIDQFRRASGTQVNLRLAIDAITAEGGVVIVTSRCEPAAVPTLDAGLRDRLDAGLTVRLHRPFKDESEEPSRQPTIKEITSVVARYFSVAHSSLVGPSRRRSLVAARNAVVYLARRLTTLSYAQIGRELGGRDHTTIMHAHQRLQDCLRQDPGLHQAMVELERIVRC